MILINLLPHREEKRRRRKQAFFAGLGAAAVLGVVIAGAWLLALQHLTAQQLARNAFLSAEIAKLDAQIKDIASLRSEIEALKARQRAVEDLQTNRNVPVYLLNELARQTPEGVYLKSIKQTGQVVAINGIAQTNERVSEFLRNTQHSSPWLERPELVEIKVAAQTAASSRDAARDQRRLYDFAMRVSLKPLQPPADAVAPARGAAPSRAPAKKP
ncbi:PilN domain-containing protein [Azohydromonas sp.]|uniref:PilN domain-containing protein n=1 Tax=Azohydromonas sp. TaxID=1872666 RepID=UPI002C49F812|nr:PilN domain-containing protein [Azohydromonas sp.]HMM84477.1 PilN domain-containing protein [Azohydromonas sp.]